MKRPRSRRVLAHARAVLVAVHVLAVTAMALPAPGGAMKRSAWADPTVQAELGAWAGRLQGLGLDLTREDLEARLWDLAVGVTRVRRAGLAPFRPYYRLCGTAQSWRMFVAPHRFPARLQVDIDRGKGWETVYVSRSATYTWRARQLDHDRLRAVTFRYAWHAYRGAYVGMADWLAEAARDDFPEARRLRVRYLKQRTPSPGEVRRGFEPAVEPQQVQVRDLRRITP